jgi:hypothetical protein
MLTPHRVFALVAFLFLFGTPAAAQSGSALLGRWVGTHDGRPWVIDFYNDTLLVVDDVHVLAFRASADSLVAFGDTSFAVSYWFVRERMLVQTPEGELITMAPQNALARPLHGDWRGAGIELWLGRGGVARWRPLSGGRWQSGEWERRTRNITFLWLPDSLEWVAQYDPQGAALLFSEMESRATPVVLRKAFRW